MIESKSDLVKFLHYDKIALRIDEGKKRPKLFSDEVWRFEIALRKAEYAYNCKKGIVNLPYRLIRKFIYHKQSVKLGYTIPMNVFDMGLSIAHYGTIVVNDNARVGKFCRIQEGVNIGASGDEKAPIIGDYVFLGSGAKLMGDIKIGDHIAVGAGAVVVNSFEENNITFAGVPAIKISSNNSDAFIASACFEKGK